MVPACPAIAIVTPDDPPADPVGDHAPAVGSVLEMLGLVGAAVVGEDAVPALIAGRPTLVLLTRREDWSGLEPWLPELARAAGCLVLEGPLPDRIAAFAGLRPLDGPPGPPPVAGLVGDPELRGRLADLLDGLLPVDPIGLGAIHVSCMQVVGTDDRGRPIREPVAVDGPAQHASAACASLTTEGGEAEPLLVDAASPDRVLLARRGRVVAAAFPLLDLLARRLSAIETPHPVSRMDGERIGVDLEHLFLLGLARASDPPLVTVEPWPVGVRSVLTIRHDVDRPVEPAAWERLLRWESAAGVRASWYFLERTAEPDRVRDVAALGHEVAYHYTHLRSVGERELAAVRAAARGAGTEIEGACCHGGNFHAMADVDWLQQQGLAYGELLTRCAPFPFRPVRGAEPRDGRAGAAAASDVSDAPPRRDVRARPCRLLATARHLSVDLKVAPPTADFDFGRRTMPARHRLGAHLIVMNHPDINFEALVDAVGAARRPEQESWTQAEVIDWWRASHLDGAQLERWPTDAGPALHLVHRADRPPVLRIWAEVEGVEDAWTDESFGAVHTLCPATSTIPLAACAGAVSRG